MYGADGVDVIALEQQPPEVQADYYFFRLGRHLSAVRALLHPYVAQTQLACGCDIHTADA